jgi:NUDIX domain
MTAVAVAIFDAEGRLLLGRDTELGCWTLPGGAVDPNERRMQPSANASTRPGSSLNSTRSSGYLVVRNFLFIIETGT